MDNRSVGEMSILDAMRILGLQTQNLTMSELTEAYRAKVRAYHPDIHGESTEVTMRHINLAREVLAKTVKRNFGLAGQETWADIRGMRPERPIVEPSRINLEPDHASVFGRLARKLRSPA